MYYFNSTFSPHLHLATSKTWYWSGGWGLLRNLSLCYSIVYYYNGLAGQSTILGFVFAWFSSLSSKLLCIFNIHGAVYIVKIFFITSFLYFLVSWAWLDWRTCSQKNASGGRLCFTHVCIQPSPLPHWKFMQVCAYLHGATHDKWAPRVVPFTRACA